MLSIEEQRKALKRQLELLKENQELTKELEFRDYRMKKLEKELEEMKKLIVKLHYNSEVKQPDSIKPTQINNYITAKKVNIYC